MFVFLFSIPYREKKKTYFFTHALLTYDIKNQTCIVMTGDILHGNYNDILSFNWGKKERKNKFQLKRWPAVSLCPPWAVSNRVTELLLGIWKETFFANVAELYKAFEMWKLGYSQQEKIILSRMHWPIVNISTTQSYLHLNLFPLECRLHVRHSQMVFTASLHYSGPTWKNQEKNMDALDSPLNSCHPSQT